MKKQFGLILLCLLLLAVLCGCGTRQETEGKPYTVVATIFPAYDWAREILGDSENVELRLLCGNGVDLHSYQVTVEDMVLISGCDLFLYVGGESDAWVDEVLESVPNPARRVLPLLDALDGHLHEEETVEGMQVRELFEEDEAEYDEHVWLSVRNAKRLCQTICDSLCTLDSENAPLYRENTRNYLQKLDALDADFTAAVEAGTRDTLLFCDRFPFRYLVEDCNLHYYAAFSGCSGDSDASFATVLFLAEKADELKLNVLLKLEDSDGQLAETVAGCTEAKNQKILTLDSMQSVSLEDSQSGITYLTQMAQNLDVLCQAVQ